MRTKRLFIVVAVQLLIVVVAPAQLPKWSVPENKQVRIVIVSDAAVEADDPVVIAYALLSPAFIVRGIVATHFKVLPFTLEQDPARTMEASYQVAADILEIVKERDCVPLRHGSPKPFTGANAPPYSEGSDLIVEEAMKEDKRPLYILALGAATDIAAAYRKNPQIAQRLTVIWIAGYPYPAGGPEYNLSGDLIASSVLMNSDIPLWQIPSPVYMKASFSMAEAAARIGAQGELGRYLFHRLDQFMSSFPGSREAWQYADLPAAAVLLQQSWAADYEEQPAPSIGDNGAYQLNQKNRPIRVYRSYDHRLALEDVFVKIAGFAGGQIAPVCPDQTSVHSR